MPAAPTPRAAAAGLPAPRTRDLILRQLPAMAVGWLLVALLWDRLGQADPAAVTTALSALGAGQWAGALGFAALSFWAVGRYDALVHGWLGTGRGAAEAGRAGLIAIAIGQTTGLGLLTGALVRLRMLPGLGLGGAVRVTLTVTALFLAGWAVVAALALALAAPPALAPLVAPAWGVLVALPAVLASAVLWPRIALAGRHLSLPPVPLLGRLTGLAAVDTLAAGLCLWAVMPEAAGLTLPDLIPAFLIAFGAGMVSGAPGGMGAFELVLMAALPEVPPETLLAGVVAWRAVYYALPALVALALLARGPGRPGRAAPPPCSMAPPGPAEVARLLATAARAEAGILRQGEAHLLAAGQGGAVVQRTGQALVALGDALGGAAAGSVRRTLAMAARAEGRVALLYKTGARAAAEARAAGWTVLPVAQELWLDPSAFDPDLPARRQLRRKLRKAGAAGLAIEAGGPLLPRSEMAAVAHAWAEAHGGERGLTMGRYAPAYVAAQQVYLARAAGQLVAFLTLHRTGREWTLDLMRALPSAPEGTMHALLARAIADAGAEGCPRLSLAALPHPFVEAALARLPARLRPAAASEGLGQFKRAFAPRAETLYAAAPGPFAFALAAADLARAVAAPPPLPAPALQSAPITGTGAEVADVADDGGPGWWRAARSS
jgi:phosphatidylglycerol lysyltransferase